MGFIKKLKRNTMELVEMSIEMTVPDNLTIIAANPSTLL